ncbi:MAG: VOC family protein [Cyanobacteria bacterium J06635_10]
MILSTIESKSRKAFQKLISTSIAIVVITFVLLGFPGLTSPAHAGPGGTITEGWVTRFNVSDGAYAAQWYEEKLDMLVNNESSAYPYYVQLFYPEYPDTQIGLSQSEPVQSGQATATIAVDDIKQAVDYLDYQGIEVAPLCNAGDNYTVLAFFCDPDGNNLALRQDGSPNKLPVCAPPVCNNSY